ncbi:hypothetical protein [Limosilactobacillus secaliphilus]|uniref:Uncharacterized protein n=1 Tax=Limosilactobacillus secaliphilus TaxID=396268 RepID=A0A0R2I6G1_9LACO|nr:hypothetical protein [Limosilactobacillus secaliphilus]KRN59222.1 hypothetical protein IV45_GL000261 [Limosilactobacillus secaliphilus]
MKRKAYTIIFLILVIVFSIYFYGHNNKNSKTSNSANQTSSSMQSEANKHKDINAELKKNLQQDQSYADSNPNNYGYAKQIDRIQYTGNSDILVNVKASFKDLQPQQKTDVMNQTQNLARMVLLHEGKIDDQQSKEGLIVTVNCGDKPVGESKISNHRKYSWY